MPLTIAICDDNEEQTAELRRLLGEWSEDKPFALMIDEYISAESFPVFLPRQAVQPAPAGYRDVPHERYGACKKAS